MTISEIAASSPLDLLIAETQGKVKVTRLPKRKAKKSELIMSMTKGVRTNTNRGSHDHPGATVAHRSIIQGRQEDYFRTSG